MTVALYALAGASSFLFVFLKAIQQLNVVHGKYWLIMPVSMAMAACEVFVVATVADRGWGWVVFPIGIGAGLGAMTAMYLHGKFVLGAKR